MTVEAEPKEQFADLNPISAAMHYGCMGLPQELVNHTVDMLHDNIPALEACSLTCRTMFASTRHLIHRTLDLTLRNNEHLFTEEEKYRLQTPGIHSDL